ncbi:MAG TPA: ABC transporter permease, partial [Blastocatellia bacterium]|nr:ABC transporter permease [Blastocatellia bacterium]
MQSLLQDLRYAARMLRKNPGFTLIAVFTLALGIGANTAIFSVVHAFLLRPLPYEAPQHLAMVWESVKRQGDFNNTVAPSNFIDWREQGTSFDDMAAYFTQSFTLTESGEPEKVEGAVVTDNLLSLLGVEASSGRVFERGDPNVEFMSAALISHGLWQRRFAGSPD